MIGSTSGTIARSFVILGTVAALMLGTAGTATSAQHGTQPSTLASLHSPDPVPNPAQDTTAYPPGEGPGSGDEHEAYPMPEIIGYEKSPYNVSGYYDVATGTFECFDHTTSELRTQCGAVKPAVKRNKRAPRKSEPGVRYTAPRNFRDVQVTAWYVPVKGGPAEIYMSYPVVLAKPGDVAPSRATFSNSVNPGSVSAQLVSVTFEAFDVNKPVVEYPIYADAGIGGKGGGMK